MARTSNDIVIDKFNIGIGDSPYVGFADMRNIDIYSEPGVAKINLELKEWTFNSSPNGISTTFTANAGTDVITTATSDNFIHDIINTASYQPVTVSSTGTLPAGLSTATTYFLIQLTQSTYKLASSIANVDSSTAIDITSAGTGTHTITAVVPSDIKHMVPDPGTGYLYAQGSTGLIWVNRGSRWTVVTGDTLTSASGNGLVIWKNYLFAFRSASIDVMKLSDYTWTNGWQPTATTATGTIHKAIAGQDDIVYFTDGRWVGSIAEATGTFNPATPATYTYNNQALDLPQDFVARDLAELGDLLMVGASKNNVTESRIFPWNRTDSSFKIPLLIPDAPLRSMQTIGNRLYVSAGYFGSVWMTNSVEVAFAFRIPPSLATTTYTVNSGITCMCVHQDRLFFGFSSSAVSGVWSFNPRTQVLALEHRVSLGSYFTGSSTPIRISSILSISPRNLAVSWYDSDNALGGIDSTEVSNTYRYSNYAAYLISPLLVVGTALQKRSISQIEFQLADPLATGEGIRLSYRKNSSGAFTAIGTFAYSTHGAITSINFAPNITHADVIQIKVELTTSTSAPGTTPRLLSITLR